MVDLEVLISVSSTINGLSSSSVTIGEITTLSHEAWNDSMEHRLGIGKFLLAIELVSFAELVEVLSGLWNSFVIKAEDNSVLFLSVNGNIEVSFLSGSSKIFLRVVLSLNSGLRVGIFVIKDIQVVSKVDSGNVTNNGE